MKSGPQHIAMAQLCFGGVQSFPAKLVGQIVHNLANWFKRIRVVKSRLFFLVAWPQQLGNLKGASVTALLPSLSFFKIYNFTHHQFTPFHSVSHMECNKGEIGNVPKRFGQT